MSKAVVRQEVEKIDGVSRTWFEWDLDGKNPVAKILVVEIELTDQEESGFSGKLIDDIEDAVLHVLQNKTTMSLAGCRVVPKGARP